MTATATRRRPETAGPRAAAGGGALAGTGTLLRFALRRDRIRLPVWIAALTLGTLSSASSFATTYPTAEDRLSIARTLNSPAGLAMSGPERYLTGGYDYGAMLGHQLISFFAVLVGLMSVLTVVRHTRAEEETGRAELLRANAVGRHAHLTAALCLAVAANLLLALLLAAGLSGMGLEGVTPGGSLLYGAVYAATGLVFAGIAATTAQVTAFGRGASGMALAAIGAAYALRATGDIGNDWVSWLSPIGWAQRTYVYVDDRWWPLLLCLAAAAAGAAAGYALSTRRDVGAGLRAPHVGRPAAADGLTRPVGFALRLHRGLLAGFTGGMVLLGVMYGSILGDVEEMIENVAGLQEAIEEAGGGSVTESFASVVLVVPAVVASLYVVMAALRPRAEETGGRAEPVLATGLSRGRWLGSHLVLALAGGTALLLAGGLAFGAAGAASTGDAGLLWDLAGASLAYAPALWVTAGVAVALFGWLPRATAAAWILPAYAFALVYLGEMIGFPASWQRLSPFGHVPQLPAADLEFTPLAVLTVLAAGLIRLGLAGFRRRDLDLK